VALLQGAAVRAAAALTTDRGHAAILPRLVADTLAQAGLGLAAMDAVAVVVGPGGFTGLRAALALAEGLALGAGRPLIGVTTGEALAEAVPAAVRAARTVWTVVDNRRGQVVLERFAPGMAASLDLPLVCAEESLPVPPGALVVAGDAAPRIAARLAARGVDVLLSDSRLPEAAAAARVAARRLAGALPPRGAAPLYAEPPALHPPPGPIAPSAGR
jgi:tRNA threonylcarbamoyladenosine biosynthesis protein TsaB